MTPHRARRIQEVLQKRQRTLTLVFENVLDPHNISAAMRTADSVGIQDVHIIRNEEPRKKNKLGHRSSGSAKQWLTVHHYDTTSSCVERLHAEGFRIWGTHLGAASRELYALDLTEPAALFFGNEWNGLSEVARAACDGHFVIPQMGMVQSLNISVACAISCYEAFRQRRAKGMYNGSDSLQAERIAKLQEAWGIDNPKYADSKPE